MHTALERRANRRVIVARRPSGLPQTSDFSLDSIAVDAPAEGEVLVRTLWLSIDGFMVGRLRAEANYATGVGLGDVMQAMAVGEVITSSRSDRRVGEIVCGMMGMQEWFVDRGDVPLMSVDPAHGPIQLALGVLGISGWTAYFGLLDIGRALPGETVAVSAGVGAVGALVGQIAKIRGCRTVAIVGNSLKADLAIKEYAYDAAVVRGTADLAEQLTRAAPDGVDVFFDNAGGDLYDTVLDHMRVHGRIVVCGRIAAAHLTDTLQDVGPRDTSRVLVKRLTKSGFLVSDFAARFPEASAKLAEWRAQGRLRLNEDVLWGIDSAPAALVRLVNGENSGKQLVNLGSGVDNT